MTTATTATTNESAAPRPLHEIADEIKADWKSIYFGAQPYVNAMRQLEGVNEAYGAETGKDIAIGFLANAGTWRGPVARRIKDELRRLTK